MPYQSATLNLLAETIRREIAAGAISFARFMELALYCPQLGYYERNMDTVGRRGDYYTSASVGPVFGEMLAFQFAGWLEEMREAGGEMRIIEAGAHDGKLAADILSWLKQRRPELFARLEYVILEPSGQRRAWQQETLRENAGKIRWLAKPQAPDSRLSTPRSCSIIFSNELLDAFPVHRLGWDARAMKWFEWGVALEGDKFVWAKLPHSAFHIPHSELESVLPDGYIIEICPAAETWWQHAASTLSSGKLVAIDYGLTAAELFRPERCGGTLRAYRRHRASDDLLADAGEQDLTAHVNFSAIQQAGEAAGLHTEGLVSQPKFLTEIAARIWKNPGAFGEWTPAHTRQFQTLVHPQHLGRAFRVLVQSRSQ